MMTSFNLQFLSIGFVIRSSNFKMKQGFKLSTHAVEKHLDVYNVYASVFFNMDTMYHSVETCLQEPDTVKECGKRTEITKRFDFDIGILGFTNKPSNKIKVIFTRTEKICFVITAYPIA